MNLGFEVCRRCWNLLGFIKTDGESATALDKVGDNEPHITFDGIRRRGERSCEGYMEALEYQESCVYGKWSAYYVLSKLHRKDYKRRA
jgi:hypothetical protein